MVFWYASLSANLSGGAGGSPKNIFESLYVPPCRPPAADAPQGKARHGGFVPLRAAPEPPLKTPDRPPNAPLGPHSARLGRDRPAPMRPPWARSIGALRCAVETLIQL